MALITINSSQSAKPSSQSPVMPAAESSTDHFQNVLKQQLSQQEAQQNREAAPKSNDKKTNAADVPEKQSALADEALRPSQKKALQDTEGQSVLPKLLEEVEANDPLLNQLVTPSATVSTNADEFQPLTRISADEETHEPVTLPLETLGTAENALLPILNMLHYTTMHQAKDEPAGLAADEAALASVTSESALGLDQPLVAGHLKERADAMGLQGLTEQRHANFNQKIVEVLQAPADFQKDLTVKSLQKQDASIVPVSLTMAMPALAATINSAPVSNNAITPQLGTPAWNDAIGQKIVWMVGSEQPSATLTLNPPDLGPIQVVIQVQNEHADTTFISQNPDVRQALEDGMDNLRNMMNDAGIQLGQANVHSEQQSQSQAHPTTKSIKATEAAKTPVNSHSTHVLVSNGLVDTFA